MQINCSLEHFVSVLILILVEVGFGVFKQQQQNNLVLILILVEVGFGDRAVVSV